MEIFAFSLYVQEMSLTYETKANISGKCLIWLNHLWLLHVLQCKPILSPRCQREF